MLGSGCISHRRGTDGFGTWGYLRWDWPMPRVSAREGRWSPGTGGDIPLGLMLEEKGPESGRCSCVQTSAEQLFISGFKALTGPPGPTLRGGKDVVLCKSDAPGGLGKGTGESAWGIVPSVQSCPGQPGVPSWTAWHWWEKALAEISPNARWVQGLPPRLGLGAGTPATLRLSCLYISPFSLDPALIGVWTRNPPNLFSPFPPARSAGPLGE